MNSEPRLICLIGAECTGKTTLAQALAERMDGLWVPEYLRAFTDANGRTPGQHEQLGMLREQVRQEAAALVSARGQSRTWVFCDTAPLLTAVYSDHVFGDASLYPLAQDLHARYALTLWLEPDIPWVADGLQREGSQQRAAVHARIEQALGALQLPYVRLTGSLKLRLLAAERLVQSLR